MRPGPWASSEPSSPPLADSADPPAGADCTSEASEVWDVPELESLVLNFGASLRVHTRAHFFSWTQGLLQGLIRHEVLLCALHNREPLSLRADSFSMTAPDPAIFSETFLRDASVALNLIKGWEERRFRPVIREAGGIVPAHGAFAREHSFWCMGLTTPTGR
jgi:hypothetical protein